MKKYQALSDIVDAKSGRLLLRAGDFAELPNEAIDAKQVEAFLGFGALQEVVAVEAKSIKNKEAK